MAKYAGQYQKYKARYHELQNMVKGGNGEYDLIIIGGGTAGLSAAFEASNYDIKIAVFDFIKPTPNGTTWGLGGTCINVGCIPKKLLQYSANFGSMINDISKFGWNVSATFDWTKFIDNIQKYIKTLNLGYMKKLKAKYVDYFNYQASFINENTIEANGKQYMAKKFIVASGSRPRYPGIPGDRKHGITSDDLFSLKETPKDTLIVGGSYIAVEIGSILRMFGFNVTIMTRSRFLRKFDQDMVDFFINKLKFNIVESVVTKVEGIGGRKRVYYGTERYLDVDTVVWAIGRVTNFFDLGLDKLGIKNINGKIVATNEQTNIPNIYAVGDILNDSVELTPVAGQAAKLLVRRLFGHSKELMNYKNIPTTVFACPLEYSFIGVSDGELKDQQVHRISANTVPHDMIGVQNMCYIKIICDCQDIVKGIHIVAPGSSEIIQGFAFAVINGIKKSQLNNMVGIHPTIAEKIFHSDISNGC